MALLGIGLNGLFSYFIFQENRKSDSLGDSVLRAVIAEHKLQDFEKTFYIKDFKNSRDTNIKELTLESQNFPMLNQVLIDFDSEKNIGPKLSQSIGQAEADLLNLIEARQEADQSQNEFVEKQFVSILVFDLILISILFILFSLNAQAKRRTERSLRASHKNLVDSLLILEEKIAHRKIATKSVVHDLKNPIGTIIGFADLMRDQASSAESVVETSERIQRISERSLQIVETLLAESDDPISINQVDLRALTEEVVERMQVVATAKKQVLEFNSSVTDAKIHGNEIKLDQLLTNLISNATKYSPPQSKIKVSLGENKNGICLVVEDQGPGFTKEDKTRAFQFGTRLTARPTAGESSSGIGLFVVKEIVELHKSKIEIQDHEKGSGARVIVTFPGPIDFRSAPTSDREVL